MVFGRSLPKPDTALLPVSMRFSTPSGSVYEIAVVTVSMPPGSPGRRGQRVRDQVCIAPEVGKVLAVDLARPALDGDEAAVGRDVEGIDAGVGGLGEARDVPGQQVLHEQVG